MNKFSPMKTRWIFSIVLLAIVAFALVACSPKASTTAVNVTMSEYTIALDKTSLPAGTVKFVVKNTGSLVHSFAMEPVGARNQPFELNGKKSETGDVQPGQTATLEWTLDKAGDYQLSCYTPGHFEQGMMTTFTVTVP